MWILLFWESRCDWFCLSFWTLGTEILTACNHIQLWHEAKLHHAMLSRKALRTARSGSVHSKHNPCHSYPIYLRGNDSKLVVIATKWRRADPPPVTISMPTPRYLWDCRDNSRTGKHWKASIVSATANKDDCGN